MTEELSVGDLRQEHVLTIAPRKGSYQCAQKVQH